MERLRRWGGGCVRLVGGVGAGWVFNFLGTERVGGGRDDFAFFVNLR